MSERMISVENVSKRYVIGHQKGKGDGLRHLMEQAARNPLAWVKGTKARRAARSEEFWALRDVSFEVKQGEVLGVIGRNGAGKSTLLKILSRITEPTSGSIRLRGRVASLLEVGTGFHPELTGRENIFMNGAILGMTRAEIRSRFDEIVAFSEVEKFLDTPVKRYSSGMYVRLAFAVAAHLEPEILIVDEVLAVGDAAFQRKCLGKMQDVATKEHRTVIFVSHNMTAVRKLCTTATLLDKGGCLGTFPAPQGVDRYHQLVGHLIGVPTADITSRPRRENSLGTRLRITAVELNSCDGTRRSDIRFGEPFSFHITIDSVKQLDDVIIGFSIRAPNGEVVFTSHWNDGQEAHRGIGRGLTITSCTVDPNLLRPGIHFVDVGAVEDDGRRGLDFVEDALSFSISEEPYHRSNPNDARTGIISLRLPWRVNPVCNH